MSLAFLRDSIRVLRSRVASPIVPEVRRRRLVRSRRVGAVVAVAAVAAVAVVVAEVSEDEGQPRPRRREIIALCSMSEGRDRPRCCAW
jgi:hypothetical protein